MIRTVGIDPMRRGLCFAVIESEERLLGWGCTGAPRLLARYVRKAIWKLLDEYDPDYVVLEAPEGSRRGRRARRAIEIIQHEALEYGSGVRRVSRRDVQRAFASNGTSKHEIAQAVARQFPELRRSLPPRRKLGDSERERMNVFDAASFAITTLPGIEVDRWNAAG